MIAIITVSERRRRWSVVEKPWIMGRRRSRSFRRQVAKF